MNTWIRSVVDLAKLGLPLRWSGSEFRGKRPGSKDNSGRYNSVHLGYFRRGVVAKGSSVVDWVRVT